MERATLEYRRLSPLPSPHAKAAVRVHPVPCVLASWLNLFGAEETRLSCRLGKVRRRTPDYYTNKGLSAIRTKVGLAKMLV